MSSICPASTKHYNIIYVTMNRTGTVDLPYRVYPRWNWMNHLNCAFSIYNIRTGIQPSKPNLLASWCASETGWSASLLISAYFCCHLLQKEKGLEKGSNSGAAIIKTIAPVSAWPWIWSSMIVLPLPSLRYFNLSLSCAFLLRISKLVSKSSAIYT